jgi:solute carrier family 25 carnitine/acylcarnitine transporter 20/29
MRLLGFVALLAVAPLVSSYQVPWLIGNRPTVSSTTLVDALSADPDYTSLIRLLQRARLIPTLNKLNGSTLFAPTNDAIDRHLSLNPLWQTQFDHHQFVLDDNVREKLRQELLYHLLNYSLPELPSEPQLQVLKTLHFPRLLTEPPSTDPLPWIPEPGGTLGGEPQRLRLYSQDGAARVGVDANGKGGAEVVKDVVQTGNGVLLGISDVLTVPPNLGQ